MKSTNIARERKTQEILIKASDHLFYEIWMLQSVIHGIASGIAGESIINNALLESFGIHARAVLDFLYSNKPKVDDVIAEDFFSEPSIWHNGRPEKSKLLEQVHSRVAKEIAHLTYARQEVKPELKGWPIVEIGHDIDRIINAFIKIVPKKVLGPRWGNTIK